MKIVTIWSTYGPYHLARVHSLTKSFPNSEVICFSHCRSSDEYAFFDLEPGNHHILVNKASSELGFFESFWSTFKALNLRKPDLVLSCGYERPETFGALIWARLTGRTIFLMLDNQYDDSPRPWLKEAVKIVYLRFFDGFVYGGDTHLDYLRRLKVPQFKEVHGYNCVDNGSIWEGVQATRNSVAPHYGENSYFLCVARMIAKKNLIKLISAYAQYVRHVETFSRPWSLVICGDGIERMNVERAIRECGVVENVVLPGRVDNFDDMINYYANAKALILGSHENEQWGLVVNEAMAAGLPVFVSKQCGCTSSIVRNGVNGFAFDGRVVDEIAKPMIWAHEHQEELPAMGEKSREIISHFSPDNFADNVRRLFHSVKGVPS